MVDGLAVRQSGKLSHKRRAHKDQCSSAIRARGGMVYLPTIPIAKRARGRVVDKNTLQA